MENYNKDIEVWKDIEGYEGFYKVSNLGNVKSLERIVTYGDRFHTVVEKMKKQTVKIDPRKNTGYNIVSLYKNNKGTHFYVHRLVATAFIDNPDKKETVNHLDGDKQNNKLDNLEWSTYLENNTHAVETKLTDYSNRKNEQTKSIGVKQQDKDGVVINTFLSMREAQRQTGCDATQISKCCKNQSKSCKGFYWSYN